MSSVLYVKHSTVVSSYFSLVNKLTCLMDSCHCLYGLTKVLTINLGYTEQSCWQLNSRGAISFADMHHTGIQLCSAIASHNTINCVSNCRHTRDNVLA